MPTDRVLDAYCQTCCSPRLHEVLDAGSCRCARCGRVELLMTPLDPTVKIVETARGDAEAQAGAAVAQG